MAAILTGSKYHLTESTRKMTTKLFVLCFFGYLCRIKKSTVLQISSLNDKTGSKSGINGKCNSFKAIHLSSEFQKNCETMIHIFKHRKGQTYEQIRLAKNRLFLFTCFNPLSPANSEQHQFSPYHIHTMSRD